MRTKLYVLGAVLGAAPGVPSALNALGGTPSLETHPGARGAGGDRAVVSGNHAVVAPLPVEQASADGGASRDAGTGGSKDARPDAPDAGLRTRSLEAPVHPCELITIVQVPCDATRATCEYTYWECPEQSHPLRV
ncbi:hypothetical protein D7Y13_38515 [Corallococcus praedator]|uniref:Uncharacterized protein n=1 Tax=Corallococcus praedator TaxID=2316724 RepID=A0ABX9Q537_9BACT|nr:MULTISPECIES: hypothetical protein [Corallococcus]RKH18479.1 hypothetical protein D7X75_39545 [Corallococcus sp. CA031C]RKH91655.1 hypothetical protein D7Y13_38515 [Corallococcus praedator]